MLVKARTKSLELQVLEYLDSRMDFSPSEKQHYLNLKKGYEGEVRFDSFTANLSTPFHILNDLLLECNNTTFQIDSLLITQKIIIPCEVKNMDGNYYYKDDNFYKCTTQKEITNPLHQLNRGETLLRQLLQKQGITLPILGNLVFVNPEFFLYQAPQSEKMIFYPQLQHFIGNLSTKPSQLNQTHHKLADLLTKLHVTDSPYTRFPSYKYEMLRKGMTCLNCQSLSTMVHERRLVCMKCGNREKIDVAILRSIEELKLLFPDIKMTTNVVFDWCNRLISKKSIGRILRQNYYPKGYGKWSYYE